jgi:hypothetical protein
LRVTRDDCRALGKHWLMRGTFSKDYYNYVRLRDGTLVELHPPVLKARGVEATNN